MMLCEEHQSTFQSQTAPKKKKYVMVTGSLLQFHPLKFLNSREIVTYEKYAQQTDDGRQNQQCLQPPYLIRKGTIQNHAWLHIAQSTFSKFNKLHYQVLPHLWYSPDLLPTNCYFFKHFSNFCKKNTSTINRMKKCFPRVHQILKRGFPCQETRKFISHWQKCADYNGSSFT